MIKSLKQRGTPVRRTEAISWTPFDPLFDRLRSPPGDQRARRSDTSTRQRLSLSELKPSSTRCESDRARHTGPGTVACGWPLARFRGRAMHMYVAPGLSRDYHVNVAELATCGRTRSTWLSRNLLSQRPRQTWQVPLPLGSEQHAECRRALSYFMSKCKFLKDNSARSISFYAVSSETARFENNVLTHTTD